MAADNHLTSSNPFGYTFPRYPTNNDPPTGPPLLDQDESSTLQNFFNDPDHFGSLEGLADVSLTNLTAHVNTNTQWSYPSDQTFSTPFQAQDHTYLPQNAAPLVQRNFAGSPEDLLALMGIPSNNATDDVLHAASTLFRYSATQSSPNDTFDHPRRSHQPPLNQAARHASLPFNMASSTGSVVHQQQQYPMANGHFRASFDNSMTPSHAHSTMYQFGSDNNFRQTGYTAPFEGLEDAATQPHIDFVRGMVNQSNGAMSSLDHSVPHTPDLSRGDHKWYSPAVQAFTNPAEQRVAHESEKPNARKRRKTKVEKDDHTLQQPISPTFNQASSPDGDDNTIVDDSPVNDGDELPLTTTKRRRASSGTQGKSGSLARKNLTEEQKRSNHIRSEQKRRNIIKQGYQDLNDLVPNLKTGGFSKSAVLTETTRYLEELQAGNAAMERLLQEIAGKQGLPFPL